MTSPNCTCQSVDDDKPSSRRAYGSLAGSQCFISDSVPCSSSSSASNCHLNSISPKSFNMRFKSPTSNHNGLLFVFLILTSICVSTVISATHFASIAPDLQGDYCRTRIGGCCLGREDECSVPILGTLCYCDQFCNRSDNADCCPDFWEFCLNQKPPPPPENYTQGCSHQGQLFREGATHKINCNQCKCERSLADPDKFEFLCERDDCLIEPSLIETINRGSYDWKARNHTDFWGRKLSEGITYRLGTLEPERAVKNMEPIKYVYDVSTLPRHFDARSHWYGMIQDVRDQQWCGSDWAFTTTAVTADRLAIQSKGDESKVLMSVQHLVSCNNHGQKGCFGGHLDRSWNFMRKFGVVDEACYPYQSGTSGTSGNCLVSRKVKSFLDLTNCQSSNSIHGRKELYRSQPAYRISPNENDIKYEISTFGPVQAVMAVPADFFMYHSGVYRNSGLRPDKRMGYHSVRIIGWGEEFVQGQFLKYWLVANTWGKNWGEAGYFKILRGENECEIETFVIAAWARPATSYSRSSRNYRF